MFCRCGKSWAMISLSLWREIALNIFFMSSEIRALVGILPSACGVVMYLSTPTRSVLTTVEIPPGTPTV